jgi:hypothetical protein
MSTEINTNTEQIIDIELNTDVNSEISNYDDKYHSQHIIANINEDFTRLVHDHNNVCNICAKCDKCSICSELFAENLEQNIIGTSCNHFFHKDCMDDWISMDSEDTCPICRKNFNTELELKPNELLTENKLISVRSLRLESTCSINYNCDYCCKSIHDIRYHLIGKNYDLCDLCYDIMLNAYNNGGDYTNLIVDNNNNRYGEPFVDEKFNPKNYIKYEMPKYELDIIYDNLVLEKFFINKNIKTNRMICLNRCTINQSILESNIIHVRYSTINKPFEHNCEELLLDDLHVNHNEKIQILSGIYQGNEHNKQIEINDISVNNIDVILVPVKNITFVNLQKIVLTQHSKWMQKQLNINLQNGEYDFGPNIEEIEIVNVKFKKIPKFGNKLKKLHLVNAVCETIKELNFSDFMDLENLHLVDIYIDKIVSFSNKIKSLEIVNCCLKELPSKLSDNLVDVTIKNNKIITQFDSNYFNIPSIETIKINKLNVESIIIPENIKVLYIYNCNLKNILNETLSDKLTVLEILNCKLESINVLPQSIIKLNLSNNRLKTIPIIPMNVKELYLTNNLISEIQFEENCRLKNIYMARNKLTKFKLISKNVENMNLSHNRLNEISLNDNENCQIETLNISHNKITNFTYNGIIKVLKCNHNNLKSLHLNKTRYVDCSYNNLSYLENTYNIITLNCSHNKNMGDTLILNGYSIKKLNVIDTQITHILVNNLTTNLTKFRYNSGLSTNVICKKNGEKTIYGIETVLGTEKRLLNEIKKQNSSKSKKTFQTLDETSDDFQLCGLFGIDDDNTNEQIIDVIDSEYNNITIGFDY